MILSCCGVSWEWEATPKELPDINQLYDFGQTQLKGLRIRIGTINYSHQTSYHPTCKKWREEMVAGVKHLTLSFKVLSQSL